MQPIQHANNVRESYRFAVDAPQQAGCLCAGGVWSDVRVMDESRGGFGVVAPMLSGVAVGDVVQLRTAAECFEVEVVHISECPPENDQTVPTLRLGLKRVRELFLDEDQPLPWYQRIRTTWRRAPYGVGRSVGMIGFVFALLIGGIPLVAIVFMDRHEIADMEVDIRKADRAAGSQSWVSRYAASDNRPAKEPARPRVVVHRPERSRPDDPAHEERLRHDWRQLVDRSKRQKDLGHWHDAVLATIADATARITLSPTQQIRIAELLQETNDALAKLAEAEPEKTADPTADQRTSILETAFGRLMELFNDAQKAQWDDLLRESSETPAS
jgi:hypothetical protein